jgi:hypothetical protein
LSEYVFEHIQLLTESFQRLFAGTETVPWSAALKHPALDSLFGFDGWQVSQRQKVFGFKVSAFLHKLLAALIVDYSGYQVREAAFAGVSRGSGADGVTMNHPSAA